MADILERIGKILVQAERTSNEHEQNLFFEKAQKLARQYSVELERARQAVTNKELRETPVNKRITIGERGKPLNAVFCELFMAIGRTQDLKFNIAHNSTYVIAFGFPSDIRIAEAIYAHVSVQMVDMANAFIKKGEWRDEMMWDERRVCHRPVHARVARRQFYEAFSMRVGSRLYSAKKEVDEKVAEEEVTVATDTGTTSTSTALVLKKKRVEIDEFYSQTSTARGSWGGNRNTYTSNTGHNAGTEAGGRARLSGQQSLPGARKQLG